eukprot:gene6143-11532_t
MSTELFMQECEARRWTKKVGLFGAYLATWRTCETRQGEVRRNKSSKKNEKRKTKAQHRLRRQKRSQKKGCEKENAEDRKKWNDAKEKTPRRTGRTKKTT